MNHAASRPKVHRLPALPKRKAAKSLPSTGLLLMALVGITALALNQQLQYGQASAHVAPEANAISASTVSDQKTDNSIVIQGQNNAIVGQMAKIPSQSQKISEIKTVSNVDNSGGRDLLSIINKY
mgnify:CR=1 FL=1